MKHQSSAVKIEQGGLNVLHVNNNNIHNALADYQRFVVLVLPQLEVPLVIATKLTNALIQLEVYYQQLCPISSFQNYSFTEMPTEFSYLIHGNVNVTLPSITLLGFQSTSASYFHAAEICDFCNWTSQFHVSMAQFGPFVIVAMPICYPSSSCATTLRITMAACNICPQLHELKVFWASSVSHNNSLITTAWIGNNQFVSNELIGLSFDSGNDQ